MSVSQSLTFLHLQMSGGDGLAGPVGGDAGVAAGVLWAHIHEDEAVLAPGAGHLEALGVRLDLQHVLDRLLLQPAHQGSRGTWRRGGG